MRKKLCRVLLPTTQVVSQALRDYKSSLFCEGCGLRDKRTIRLDTVVWPLRSIVLASLIASKVQNFSEGARSQTLPRAARKVYLSAYPSVGRPLGPSVWHWLLAVHLSVKHWLLAAHPGIKHWLSAAHLNTSIILAACGPSIYLLSTCIGWETYL